ncbi:MAG: O-antigen ligase family protein [Candidatus Omnitrophica bacterium]|nr:O-antigen ligase family protein [Candidatus Omnitrophota bacterium]
MIKREKIGKFCESVIFWLIVAIPFVASFSSAAVDGCIGALIFFFIFKRVVLKERNSIPLEKKSFLKGITIHPVLILFFVLFVIALLSFWNTISIDDSLKGMGKLLKYGFLLIIVFFEVRDVRHIQKIVLAAISGLLLVSLDGIYQLVFGVDLLRQHHYDVAIGVIRLNATFPHTNIFAGYLALFIPALIPVVLYYAKKKQKVAGIIVVILALFCLAFTFCRSALLGVFLVLLLMSVVRKDKVIFVLLLASILVVPFVIPRNVKDWSKTTNSWVEIFLGKDRPIIYETAFNMINHHPFLGVGVNTFSRNYQKYKLHNAILDPGNENNVNGSWYAHNSYLQMAGETGIVYFLVFVVLMFAVFREAIFFYRCMNNDFLKFCSLGIMMGLVSFMVHGFTETNLYNPKIAVLFWFQVAFLMAVVRIGKDSRTSCSDYLEELS